MKWMKHGFFGAFLFGILASALTHADLPGKSDLTLLVVPARFNVLQVCFDVIEYRKQIILLSYQGEPGKHVPVIYAWKKDEWVYISLDDYADADFLKIKPDYAVIVGGSDLLPHELEVVAEWCPNVLKVPVAETTELINAMGEVFSFSRYEWTWFAKRYKRELRDIRRKGEPKSWYDQSRDEFLRREAEIEMRKKRGTWDDAVSEQLSIEPASVGSTTVEPMPVEEIPYEEPPVAEVIEQPGAKATPMPLPGATISNKIKRREDSFMDVETWRNIVENE